MVYSRFVLLLSFSLVNPLCAELQLAPLFQTGAVLQRDKQVPVWGRGDAGDEVTVSFAGQKLTTKADASGRWSVSLAAMPANAVGAPLDVRTADGERVECGDVVVGEVWLASGQSNMQWPIARVRPEDQQAAAAGPVPLLRVFQVPAKLSHRREETTPGSWNPANPETIKNFSAVGYFFGRHLAEKLQIPVGIIHSSWGGSRIEPWWAEEGLEGIEELAETRKTRLAGSPGFPEYDKPYLEYLSSLRDWTDAARSAFEAGKDTPAMPPAPPLLALGHNKETGTYQAMIHPLVPFALRGFIWYQGESNNGEGMAYTAKMRALIQGWRGRFRATDAPFLFVQLAPFRYNGRPAEDLAGIWQAQQAALAIPHTGMAVTMDIGDPKDIHPTNKSEVGRRLALWALADTYALPGIVKSGPLFSKFKADGDKLFVRFDHTGSGLTTRDGKAPTHFEIAGADGVFHPATAEIAVGADHLVLRSAAVVGPERARFAWNDSAEPNLMNKEGLPAAAFHTHWPEKTAAPSQPVPAK